MKKPTSRARTRRTKKDSPDDPEPEPKELPVKKIKAKREKKIIKSEAGTILKLIEMLSPNERKEKLAKMPKTFKLNKWNPDVELV